MQRAANGNCHGRSAHGHSKAANRILDAAYGRNDNL